MVFKKGSIPWNKETKGLVKPNSGSFKKGQHNSPNTEFKKGHQPTEQLRKKLSLRMIGNILMKGKKFSKETKNKMSISRSKDKHWNWRGGKKLANQRHHSKRRHLNHIFMNEPFENSEGHHLDNDFILYIPKELHRSVWHNQTTGKNMELINTKAFEWMISQLQKSR